MNVEVVIKLCFPILAFFFTISFLRKNKIDRDDHLVIWIFYGYFCLSSNFQFFYREIYQFLIAVMAIKSLKSLNFSRLGFPLFIFGLLFLIILLSYIDNKIIISKVAQNNIIKTVSFSCFSFYYIYMVYNQWLKS
mgnify:CR=1 FL=1